MLSKLRPYMMPIAILVGIVFYKFFYQASTLTPILIFFMLFFTFLNIGLHNLKIKKLHIILMLIQVAGSLLLYLAIAPYNKLFAQAAMICLFAPTASSAPVITRMLGGSIASITAYCIMSNLCIAVFAPVFFSFMGTEPSVSFVKSLWELLKQMFLLIVLPLLSSVVIRHEWPELSKLLRKPKNISFYLWNIALIITSASTVHFITAQESKGYTDIIVIGSVSLVICCLQFLTGHLVGKKLNEPVVGTQGLGQKNTIITIWLCQVFLNPIASLAPGSYILWQNIINSYQVWKQRKGLK